MSLDNRPKKRNEDFLERPDSCGSTPEGEDHNRPQAHGVRFEQLIRIVNLAWPFPFADTPGCGLTVLVRKDT